MNRSVAWRLLSDLFHPPARERWLDEGTCVALPDALGDAVPAAEALHEALQEVSDLDLRADHAALFVGPFALEAPPYGSVHLEAGRALMGETTMAAAAAYAAAGLTVVLREPADHVAVELEFLYVLAVQGREEAHARFLAEHLGAWAPAFCAAVRRSARTRFYRVLADCLEGVVGAEVRRPPEVTATA